MATRYLSVADVLALHSQTMGSMGELAWSLRDSGLLESAIVKPQVAAHYEDADIVRQAAVLAIGISTEPTLRRWQ